MLGINEDIHKISLNNVGFTCIVDEARSNSDPGRSEMGEQTTVQTRSSAKQTTKKERLLTNPDVKRWHDNLARWSVITADTRLRKLGNFCELHNMTPMQLAELGMRDLRAITDLLQDHITFMEQEGKAPGYIKSTMTATKSWLHHFDIDIKRKMRISNVDSTPTLEDERVPEASEMVEILNRAKLREAATISLVAKSGLRPETLGNHDGTDGLMMKDLPDIAIVQGVARCLNTPPRIIVRRPLSKARHQYFTFVTANGTKKLLAYLNDRLWKGEVLNAESPLVAPDLEYNTYRGKNNGKRFLPTQRILGEIRGTFRPRFQWRPYVLRAYFDTQLLIAESKGKIAHDFRVFFMGHKGSMEAKYTTNKGILPEQLITEMCESFKRSQEFLDLEVKEEDPLLKQKEQLKVTIDKATPEQMQRMLVAIGIGNI